MDVCGCLWIFVDFCGIEDLLVVGCFGCLWIFVELRGILRTCGFMLICSSSVPDTAFQHDFKTILPPNMHAPAGQRLPGLC